MSVTNIRLRQEIEERKKADQTIRASLREKETLLKEIHHRVKNNLQIISSLLYLQSNRVKDESISRLLHDSRDRIRSMALIHENLYRTENMARINMQAYIRDLLLYLLKSYDVNRTEINIRLEIKRIYLNIDRAIPCGLIINEAVSNALKYAFSKICLKNNIPAEIKISLSKKSSEYILSIEDNGIGLPPDYNPENGSSLGMRLIFSLADQINGTVRIRQDSGLGISISFPQKMHTKQSKKKRLKDLEKLL